MHNRPLNLCLHFFLLDEALGQFRTVCQKVGHDGSGYINMVESSLKSARVTKMSACCIHTLATEDDPAECKRNLALELQEFRTLYGKGSDGMSMFRPLYQKVDVTLKS
eukprot:6481929-Amphidinium_carterae.6